MSTRPGVRAVVVVAVMAALGIACKKDSATSTPSAKAGDGCGAEGALVCVGDKDALVCVGGKYEAHSCASCAHEPKGDFCYGATASGTELGTPCFPYNDEDYFKHECSSDKKAQLLCKDSHWVLEKKCPGKKGCRWEKPPYRGSNDYIACDEVLYAKGADCPKDGTLACAVDGVATLRCAGGHWAEEQFCRGPDGCEKNGSKLSCDDTLAKAGDPCAGEGAQACAVDGKHLLACKAGKMVEKKACATCKVDDTVSKTNPTPHYTCN